MMRRMSITRREALASLAVFAEMLAAAHSGEAQTPAAAAPPPVFRGDLPPVNLDGWEVTVSHVEYPPGRVGTAHHHAGFVLAYVLQGRIVTKVSGQGPERTLSAGQMFYEQPGATHEVSRNASQTEPAKLLAMIFAKKGSTLTTQGPA
jgi:quercetin dioxygenase-like cupin family protein